MPIREGMVWLVNRVRTMIDDDRVTYLSDDVLQSILDEYSIELIEVELDCLTTYSGGTPHFVDYQGPCMIEGPPNLHLMDGNYGTIALPVTIGYGEHTEGSPVGTATYVDLLRGRFRFATAPIRPVRLSGRKYDLYGAAAAALRIQAAQVAQHFDVSTDGVDYKRSQKHEQLLAQAATFARLSTMLTKSSVQVRADAY